MPLKQKTLFCSLFLLLFFFGLAQPATALAALSITTVTPDEVVNDIANTITITGTDFEVGAQVKIGGSDVGSSVGLLTNRISDTELIAYLPQGFSPGVYTVYVLNPATTFSLPAGLTVLAPVPIPTSTPQPFFRPQISVVSYSTNVDGIRYGKNFTLSVRLKNSGGGDASGIQASFLSSELLMLKNGGVITIGDLAKGNTIDLSQIMTAANPFYGVSLTALEMNISYYDPSGTQYTEKFSLILNVFNTVSGIAAATATPTGVHLSQLIISEYQTDLEQLEPGSQFTLQLSIKNQGDLPASSVLMIVGGGANPGGGSGTPGPGGVSGGGGDFTNFAPVGSSNLQSLGNIPPNSSREASHQMIVNVNTNPGAYPMKVTFSYTDPSGNQVFDEQVITLLVYSLPKIDISFYQPVTELYSFQPNLLPIQIVNIGRRLAVLGNLSVTSPGGQVDNGQTFVGALDTGGYFALDVMLTPEQAGETEVLVSVDYTDDFNQTRTITKTLPLTILEVQADPALDPSNPDLNGGVQIPEPETFWGKIWRFILGLFGLDSGSPADSQPIQVEPEIIPQPGYKPGKG